MNGTTPITAGPDGIFEIRAQDVDLGELVRTLERNLAAHGPLYAHAPAMPSYGLEDRGPAASSAQNLSDLLYHIRGAEQSYQRVGAEKELAPSWAARLPLIGRWWRRMRSEAHNLVLFYVNRAAGRQASFNEHAVGVLRHVAEQAERIERLEASVNHLADRLASMEADE